MFILAQTVSTGAVLSALMTITSSTHAGVIQRFHLVHGDNVPLIDQDGEPNFVDGYRYGPSPCINDSLDGSYFIGFNRYHYPPDDKETIGDSICGDSLDILNELHVIQNDGTIHWIGDGHHPALTDDTPLILYWEMTHPTEGETWIDPTLDPDSRGNGCNLGPFYKQDPDENASCEFTDTVGMPTLDAELGRALVLGRSGALVLKQPGCLDMPVILTEVPDTFEPDATYTRHLPRISVISASTAVFLVHWTTNDGSQEVVSGLYSIDLNDVSGKQASASLRVFTDMEFYLDPHTKTSYRITSIGLSNENEYEDGVDSRILRTINVNDYGQIVFRCEIEFVSSPKGNPSGVIFDFGNAILSLSPQESISVIAYDQTPFAGKTLCSEDCSKQASRGDQFHPVVNGYGDIAFTAADGDPEQEPLGTQGIFVKRHLYGLNQTPIRDLVVMENNTHMTFKAQTELSARSIIQLGKSEGAPPDSHYVPFAMSSYGDIAVYCRLEQFDEYTDDLILIFDRKGEVLAWIREGDGLRAHVWNDDMNIYEEQVLVIPETMTFDCNPSDHYWFSDSTIPEFGNYYSFLVNCGTSLGDITPFSFARGSGGEDGRARAFGNYGETARCWHVPERSFVFAGDVAVHGFDPATALRCTSGIFEIRLPALSEDENWESCPEDLNNDGWVNVQDFSIWLINFGARGCNIADFNGDEFVNVEDLQYLLIMFGLQCPE